MSVCIVVATGHGSAERRETDSVYVCVFVCKYVYSGCSMERVKRDVDQGTMHTDMFALQPGGVCVGGWRGGGAVGVCVV